jgi:hypothetical protein
MLTVRRRLIPVFALVVVLSLAVVWLLFRQPSGKAFGADVNVPSRAVRAASLDRPRPEIRVEREFRLEEFMEFDPEFAPWLNVSRDKYSAAGMHSEQVASLPDGHRRSGER